MKNDGKKKNSTGTVKRKRDTMPSNSNKWKLLGFILSLAVSYCVYAHFCQKEYAGKSISINISGSLISFTRTMHLTYLAAGSSSPNDLYKALGWMHAKDRYVQICLMRLVAQGRLTETFPYTDINFYFDSVSRKYRFHERSLKNMEKYTKHNTDFYGVLTDYITGINTYISSNPRPLEFVLLGYHPEPFTPEDVTTLIRFISYTGLNEISLSIEKFLVQLIISKTVSHSFLKEVFHPHLNNLTQEHVELYESIGDIRANDGKRSPFLPPIVNSNNWVVSGKRSVSGMPIMGSDPHLDVVKQPNTFYESQYKSHDGKVNLFGVSVPGIPMVLMGRTEPLLFSFTYGMMDMGDFFVENIVNKTYERDGIFLPLEERHVNIGRASLKFYETAEGHVIDRSSDEGDLADGRYLASRLSQPTDAEDKCFRLSLLPFAKTVKEAQDLVPQSYIGSNYLFADLEGDIGYQQAGYVPLRDTSHGLLPLPAWDSRNLWKGYLRDEDYKRDTNPPEGFFATANNVIQDPAKPIVNTYPALPTRVNRITHLLREKERHSVKDMMKYQGDTFSRLANMTIPLIDKYLPYEGIGNELRHWDRFFQVDSRAAAFWFDFWEILTVNVNRRILTPERLARLKPVVMNKYTMYKFTIHGVQTGSVNNHDMEPIFRESVEEALRKYDGTSVYGDKRKYFARNVLIGGTIPEMLGMGVPPTPVNSGFEVLKVGSYDKYNNDDCVFSQTWRFVSDVSERTFYSILPGGPSGNYFSNIYLREIQNYIHEIYKEWTL